MDQFDRHILNILQKEGRITNLDLADRVGLSPTATGERVKRLTRDGFITGYAAKVDPAKVSRGLLVFVEVALERTTADIFDAFESAVCRAPEVMECHMIAGRSDYLLKARVQHMSAYRRFLSEVLLSLPGIRETHTYAVMQEVKSDNLLPI